MKKLFAFIKTEQGFFLPYIMLIITLTIILLTSNLNTYKNELLITRQSLEYIQCETLIQMALIRFHNEYVRLPVNEQSSLFFTFPNGTVDLHYTQLSKDEVHIKLSIQTEDETNFQIRKQITVRSNE